MTSAAGCTVDAGVRGCCGDTVPASDEAAAVGAAWLRSSAAALIASLESPGEAWASAGRGGRGPGYW